MVKAVIYCRVSTTEQANFGFSLKAQEDACTRFAQFNSFSIDRIFIEKGESAKTTNRTELLKLFKYIGKNKDIRALIVWKYDRLTRDLNDYLTINQKMESMKIKIYSVTENNEDNADGKFMRDFHAITAQYENRKNSERTKLGLERALKEGRWCWPAPIGYRFKKEDGHQKSGLVPTEDAPYIIKAYELAAKGIYHQTEIVKMLQEEGCKKISKSMLNRILRNPLYAGLIKHHYLDDCINGIHEPIISQELYFVVQNILEGKRPKLSPQLKNNPDFPLRNFIRCEKCHKKLTGSWSRGRHKIYPYYHCTTKGCSNSLRKEDAEDAFYRYLKGLQPEEEMVDLFTEVMKDLWKEHHYDLQKEEHSLLEKQKNLEDYRDATERAAIEGKISQESYQRQLRITEDNLSGIEERIHHIQLISIDELEECLDFSKDLLTNLADFWQNADLDYKQRFQQIVFPGEIYINKMGRLRTTKTALIFKTLGMKSSQKYCLAPQTERLSQLLYEW